MNHPQEMQVFNDKAPEQTQIEVQGLSSYDRDQYDLARLGKKQVLKGSNVRLNLLTLKPCRRFNVHAICISCADIVVERV
ncbi:MAG: hypothetical protein Q9185_004106 [Variospora sp. 1 TL-2023]